MNTPWLRSITAVPCRCLKCGWAGLTGECESGPDGELICPTKCATPVQIHYAQHEGPHRNCFHDANIALATYCLLCGVKL